jgi:hypothetical protein
MLDCGCTGHEFMDSDYAHRLQLSTFELPTPRSLEAFDGTLVPHVTHVAKATLNIHGYREHIAFYLSRLGHYLIVLGKP